MSTKNIEINKDLETKELELGVESPTNEEPKLDDNSSFKNKKDSNEKVGTKNKLLIGILVSILFIGAGIPAGMAMTGYFGKYHGINSGNDMDSFNNDESKITQNMITNKTNDAIIWTFDGLLKLGYINQATYDRIKSSAKSDADDAISTEKDQYQSDNGNTWKDAWNKHLNELGFDNEDQYRNSKIAAKYKDKIISSYTDVNNIVKTKTFETKTEAEADINNYVYHSEIKKVSLGYRFMYVENNSPINLDDDSTNDVSKDFVNPEDLLSTYLKIANPFTMTDTLIPFTSSVPLSSKTNFVFDANGIKEFESLYKGLESPNNWVPKTNAYGGLITLSSIGQASEINSSIYSRILNIGNTNNHDATSGFGDITDKTSFESSWIYKTFDDSLKATNINGSGDPNSIDDPVETWTDAEISAFGKTFASGINEYFNDTDGYRYDFISQTINGNEYIITLSSDGIHMIGLTDKTGTWDNIANRDTEIGKKLIQNALNIKLKTDDSVNLDDVQIFDSYKTWVTTNLDKILFNQYLLANKESEWVTEKIIGSFYGSINTQIKKNAQSIYSEKNTLIETNPTIYNLEKWKSKKDGISESNQYLNELVNKLTFDENINRNAKEPIDIIGNNKISYKPYKGDDN